MHARTTTSLHRTHLSLLVVYLVSDEVYRRSIISLRRLRCRQSVAVASNGRRQRIYGARRNERIENKKPNLQSSNRSTCEDSVLIGRDLECEVDVVDCRVCTIESILIADRRK